ncbi:hypothetical protein L1987_46817 [Smallanthus sonchifolius]|uniref:Uncharacterized protein n=1 Tax=Smallanthus sonchifolius TaxID=185202 RepID=A0ACB9G083_9ASTR|nr:hypothetical protein L1987_46817 [Smallanthus sonchifolius]
MGGGQISVKDDTRMYRLWDQDDNYIYGAAFGLTPVYDNPIMYTMETPNYTAPKEVYQTQRSMGQLSNKYSLTWTLPVDYGFYYMLRLHFCNIIPQYTIAVRLFSRSSLIIKLLRGRLIYSTGLKVAGILYSRITLCLLVILMADKANKICVLCARPVIIQSLPKQEVNLAEWGKFCHQKGILHNIIDPELRGVIAPECLRHFGAVAVSCLNDQGSDRTAMEKVVWDLEFALKLQEAAEKTVGWAVSENEESLFPIQGEVTNITDDDVFKGSTSTRNGTSSISTSYEGFKSETVGASDL